MPANDLVPDFTGSEGANPRAASRHDLGFRADINGLRAIAVLVVLCFHFGIAPFAGGFIGVDVFFVISGFLMTGIILTRTERGNFSLLGFYLDRARRIVPALAVLLAAALLLGLALVPVEYNSLSKQIIAASLFESNIFFSNTLDYFHLGDNNEWLLHSWSLGVEWQFYLIYPVMVLLTLRLFGRRGLVPTIVLLSLVSFIINLYETPIARSANFFLLPARGWELLAGALAYMFGPWRWPGAMAGHIAGVAIIVVTAMLANEQVWPGVFAIAPIAGTTLAIVANRPGAWDTGNAVAAWVGLRSYSIYLWHWPLAVLLKRSEFSTNGYAVAGAVVLSFALGALSYRYIEQALLRRRELPRIHVTRADPRGLRSLALYFLPLVIVAALAAGIWRTKGFSQRFSAEVRTVDADIEWPAPICPRSANDGMGPCDLPATVMPSLVFFGDSHAAAEASGLADALADGGIKGFRFGWAAGCAPLLGARAELLGKDCEMFNARALPQMTRRRNAPLVLGARWSHYIEQPTVTFVGINEPANAGDFEANLYKSACRFAAAGPTYIELPTPEFSYSVPQTLQYRLIRDQKAPDLTAPISSYLAQNARVLPLLRAVSARCGVRLLDPTPYLCPRGICLASLHHRPLYRDTNHLSSLGAALIKPMYAPVLHDLAAARAADPAREGR